jgi:hypothetical protein
MPSLLITNYLPPRCCQTDTNPLWISGDAGPWTDAARRACSASISDTRGALPTQKLCSAPACAAGGAAGGGGAAGAAALGALRCAEVDAAPPRPAATNRRFPSSSSRLAACARAASRLYAATSAASHARRNAAAKRSAEQSALRRSASSALPSAGGLSARGEASLLICACMCGAAGALVRARAACVTISTDS